jgi:hypothetical protein
VCGVCLGGGVVGCGRGPGVAAGRQLGATRLRAMAPPLRRRPPGSGDVASLWWRRPPARAEGPCCSVAAVVVAAACSSLGLGLGGWVGRQTTDSYIISTPFASRGNSGRGSGGSGVTSTVAPGGPRA